MLATDEALTLGEGGSGTVSATADEVGECTTYRQGRWVSTQGGRYGRDRRDKHTGGCGRH